MPINQKKDYQPFIQLLPDAGNRIKLNEPMKDHTSFRIGGPADLFFEPVSTEEIIQTVNLCDELDIPLTILGRGSNVLVSDLGIRGVVIAISDLFSGIEPSHLDTEDHDRSLYVKAGTRLASLASFAAREQLRGLEFASGIPGTLGGAIIMNAGAYDGCMADVITQTEFIDYKGIIHTLEGSQHDFSYRHSYFSSHAGIILHARLKLHLGDSQAILAKMADFNLRRQKSQPLDLPSAGSAFKRPAGHYAGKLIADHGLQGCRIGDAQVSLKHAGFIVNRGEATASDVKALFNKVSDDVYNKTGVRLKPEVKFVGEWPTEED